jgi:hypothetical protein
VIYIILLEYSSEVFDCNIYKCKIKEYLYLRCKNVPEIEA